MSRIVHCEYSHQDAEGLDFVPWPGELGKRVRRSERIVRRGQEPRLVLPDVLGDEFSLCFGSSDMAWASEP